MAPLATTAELEVWLGSAIADEPRADAVLAAVSSLVRSFAARTWEGDDGPVPAEVAAIVVDIAGHIYRNPAAVRQETTGPFGATYAIVQGLSLTDDQKAILRRYGAQQRGLWTMGVTRDDPAADTEYVPVVGTDALFPWYSSSEAL
jgi:hypothetical protein